MKAFIRGDKMEEKRLVTLAAGGDKAAFAELYGTYKDRLYRYAFYRLGNNEDAEDAVSDCVVMAWRGIPSLKKPEAFAAWIFRILYCSCSALISSQAMRRQMKDISDSERELHTDMSDTVEKTELQEALTILKEDERDIVLLSVIMGFSSKEVARITGFTAGSVRSKLSRSLKKMRVFLEGDNNEAK